MFKEKSLAEFAQVLASSSPTPGGGGASALAAALGASLGAMIGNITKGKKTYARFAEDNSRLAAEMEDISQKLIAAVDRDAEAFEPLSRVYSMPKDDPNRPEMMEWALIKAAAVPFEILQLCCRAIDIHAQLAVTGSRLALPDVATGVVLCRGAMYGAAVNVRANTHLMADKSYAGELNDKVDELMEKYWKTADKVFEDIYGGLK